MAAAKFSSVDDYIASFPKEIQTRLRAVRTAIKTSAPQADEVISYGIPTYILHGRLVYFAAYKHHIALFATRPVADDAAFRKQLETYAGPKGNLKFPLDEPLPTA